MNRIAKLFIIMSITFAALSFATPVRADGSMETAISWMISIANDNTHGYNQVNRWGSDYDCSSFIIAACWEGGFALGYDSRTTGYTGDMISAFRAAGFRWISASELGLSGGSTDNLLRGDILLTPGVHCEVYLGGGYMVGATGDTPTPEYPNRSSEPGDQGSEICIRTYENYSWSGVLRYDGTVPVTAATATSSSGKYATGNYSFNGKTSLNIRKNPGTDNPVVGRVYPGDSFQVTSVSGNWGYVSFNGVDGWLYLEYCKFNGVPASTAAEAVAAENTTNASVTGTTRFVKSGIGALNLRSGAGLNYPVIDAIPAGTKISVKGYSGNWAETSYDGQNGFVSSNYLTGNGSTLKVKADVLNVRSGPGTSSGVITQITYGETVNVLDYSNGWYKVTCNGFTGWVMGSYVR